MTCTTPNCPNEATLKLLGKHPICRTCGDEKNRKARERSAKARAKGHYSPSIMARWSESKRKRMAAAAGTHAEQIGAGTQAIVRLEPEEDLCLD
jgi:ribosome assembly protein YihI (activator of Der GTPase)